MEYCHLNKGVVQTFDQAPLLVLKADWILPVTSGPVNDACILIRGNKIEKIAYANSLPKILENKECHIYDYGKALIMPGLINLHTHLEHTDLRALAVESDFLDWLPGLMSATAKWSFEDRARCAQMGINEIISAGTTLVVDCSYNGASVKVLAESGLRAIVGLETFGVDESSAKKQWQQWLQNRDMLIRDKAVAKAFQNQLLNIVAAPHSTYTVCPALWREAYKWSKENDSILLTHLAESGAEYNWFKNEDEGLKRFLIGAFSRIDPDFALNYERVVRWKNSPSSPVEHLHKIGILTDKLLAAHVVQVDDNNIEILKQTNVAIAHCPRSNQILRCGRAPMEKFLNKGIRIGFGTDGAGSTGDLDLLSEASFAQRLHQNYAKINAKEIVEFLTIKAATCLNLDDKVGSLEPGKLADLAIFSMPETINFNNSENLYELLTGNRQKAIAVYVDGKKVEVS